MALAGKVFDGIAHRGRSQEGKRRAAVNGRRPPDPDSRWQLRASLADVGGMMTQMAELRRALGGL